MIALLQRKNTKKYDKLKQIYIQNRLVQPVLFSFVKLFFVGNFCSGKLSGSCAVDVTNQDDGPKKKKINLTLKLLEV